MAHSGGLAANRHNVRVLRSQVVHCLARSPCFCFLLTLHLNWLLFGVACPIDFGERPVWQWLWSRSAATADSTQSGRRLHTARHFRNFYDWGCLSQMVDSTAYNFNLGMCRLCIPAAQWAWWKHFLEIATAFKRRTNGPKVEFFHPPLNSHKLHQVSHELARLTIAMWSHTSCNSMFQNELLKLTCMSVWLGLVWLKSYAWNKHSYTSRVGETTRTCCLSQMR